MCKWISVKERMPPSNRKVLFLELIPNMYDSTLYKNVYVGYAKDGHFFTLNLNKGDEWISARYITHWMPIPELPEEEK